MIHNNKQILGSLKQASESLQSIIDQKDAIMKSTMENLSEDEKKEFLKMKSKLNVFINNQDFNGAFNFITKHQMQNNKPEKKETKKTKTKK